MKRREFIGLLGGAAAAWPLAAQAQPASMPVIGFLHSGSPEQNVKRVAALRKGLNTAGFVEGKNVAIEFRWASGQNDRLPELHLDEIAARVTAGAHAILILDQAGWHGAKDLKIPSNLSLLPLPPRAPELNPQENIWQFMRQNWLSNRIFKSFDDIVDHCCYAWNTLIDQPWKIMSIARRDWAVVGQSI
jgi:DDE superfamily endonuclease